MSRLVPYRYKAPEGVAARIEETLSSTMYLVQTPGPTSYVIQEQNCEKKHRVLIGSLQSCSCGTADICVHILFVMLKVLRVPPTTPVVWQKSLIDSEVETLLRGGYRERVTVERKPYMKRKKNETTTPKETETEEATRHELVEGEVCAICQEDMDESQPLTFCRKGCGNNFHIKCMKVFGESRRQSKENIICPLCRQDWGDLALSALRKEIDVANRAPNVHKGTCCRKCKIKPIRCERYRCVQCKNVDLCARCFKGNAHVRHAFVMKQNVQDHWVPAVRESQQQPAISSDVIRDLENRELSTNDYDVLLQLDHGERPIQDYLVKIIAGTKTDAENAKTFGDPGATCSLCSQSLKIKAVLHSTLCGHVFHESCLARSILAQVYSCPFPGCENALVPGLLYLQQKRMKSSGKEARSGNSDVVPESTLPVLDSSFAILGLQQQKVSTQLRYKASKSRLLKQGDSQRDWGDDHELPALLSIGIVPHERPTMASSLPPISARHPTPPRNQLEHENVVPSGPGTNLIRRTTRVKGKLLNARRAGNNLPQLDRLQQQTDQADFSVSFPADTYDSENRLSHAEKIRAELKAVEKERLQKQRLQREERRRRHKESNDSPAFAGGFIGMEQQPRENVSILNSQAQRTRDMKRKTHQRQQEARNPSQFPSALPDLFIGSKG